MTLEEAVYSFQVKGKVITEISKYGKGHINGNFFVKLDDKYEYILQKINHHIFPNIDGLMNNIVSVTNYLKDYYKRTGGDPDRQTLTVVFTKDNRSYLYDEESNTYYRIYTFVSDSISFEAVENKEQFAKLGETFAEFSHILSGFDASSLCEVIPNFHNTQSRFDHFLKTLKEDKFDRAKSIKDDIEFVLSYKDKVGHIVDLINKKEIPLRVTHNDTKLNNVLFDVNTRQPLCVVDLDTIMPGSILFDFGDAIRFGCNPTGEDEVDLSKVIFNTEYFKAYTEGYIKAFGDSMTATEKDNLAFSAILMTLECGIRFLDDFLDGEKYFRVEYEGQNLVRARTQFHLVKQMEAQFEVLDRIVHTI